MNWTTVAGTAASVRPTDLAVATRAQVGIAPNQAIEMRVQSVCTWNLTGNAVAQRAFDLKPPSTTVNDPLSVLVDRPGRNRWARVGYSFSSTQRMNCLQSTDATTTIFQTEGEVAGDRVISYVHILWRPSTTVLNRSTFADAKIGPLPPISEVEQISNEIKPAH
jgi:hypothetical protein